MNINKKINNQDPQYQEIADNFYALRDLISKHASDTAKAGLAGWSDEERRIFEDISFKVQDGGYSSILRSVKHGFEVVSSYQYNIGSYFVFFTGDLNALKECLTFLSNKYENQNK